MSRRRLEKFTDAGGANAYVFPIYQAEWEPSQSLRNPRTPLTGADYAHDNLVNAVGIKDVGAEVARFTIIEDTVADLNDEFDTIRNLLYSNGRGKLWSLAGEDDRRWCWARLRAIPSMTLGWLDTSVLPVVCEFDRLSDWYAEDRTDVAESINSSPAPFTVPNPGNAQVRNAVIELHANGAGGFQSLTIENLSTGDSIGSSRVAQSADSRLRIDCGRHTVEYSNDAGVSWTDDYGNVSWGDKQVDFMRFLAGSNSMRYSQSSGSPSLDVQIRFYGVFT